MPTRPTVEGMLARQPWPSAYAGHPDWPELIERAAARLAAHGDLSRWTAAMAELPDLVPAAALLGDRVGVTGAIAPAGRDALTRALQGLTPWRKGPFELFGVHIDTEWRSDWKWRRIAAGLGDLSGQSVLDVGCGNGYFGWRALEAGADSVLGVDPSVLFFLQHATICRYLDPLVPRPNALLPLPFEALPEVPRDLALSMGVIYHRPEPAEHLDRLYRHLRPGGRLLLESLVVTHGDDVRPGRQARYARMRNVSVVPRVETLLAWLEAAGFQAMQVLDVTPTRADEQRRTPWMTFESLAEALDPADPGRTVEGYPAPVRAAILAHRPGPGVSNGDGPGVPC
ncbi:MAG: tRNA 5-methoxyuridine(34)/uridine 5-oxyacetic acid(34) synthase CmoB [Pseudomonadales bacterium]